MSGTPTSNKNDAKSFSKLALLASAAATAVFVVSQSRLMQRITEPGQALRVPPAPRPEPVEPVKEAPLEAPAAALSAELTVAEAPVSETPIHTVQTESAPSAEEGNGNGARIRVRATRPARERLHYGFPVRSQSRRHSIRTIPQREEAAAVVVLEPPSAPATPTFDNEEFDAEYLAICEAIAHDGRQEEPEPEEEPTAAVAVAAASAPARDAIEEMWWLPAPRLRYIIAALAYVAVSVAAGSDPITLAADGFHALTTINSTADLILLGWIFLGLLLLIPSGAIAVRLLSFVTRGRAGGRSIRSVGWGLRFIATAAFIAGTILYSPHALRWALDTDYPVASVATTSMAPALDEGELVLINGVGSIDDLDVGDIIAFEQGDGLAVLRVTAFENGAVVGQADAGTNEDFLIPFDDVAGRVLTLAGTQIKLPLLGNLSPLGERTVEPRASLIGLP